MKTAHKYYFSHLGGEMEHEKKFIDFVKAWYMKVNTTVTYKFQPIQIHLVFLQVKANWVTFSVITACIHTRKHLWHLEPEQMNTEGALLDYQDELQITA